MAPTPLTRLDAALGRIADYVGDRAARGVSHDDADDTLGTIECDDAAGFDPVSLLAALHDHGAHAVVIGQVAGILHGSQELTGDLDLLWSGAPRAAPRFAAAFAAVGASVSDDDHQPLPLDASAFALPKVLFHAPSASGDCCTPQLPWGALDILGVLDRAESISERGVTVHYATLTDLVAMRRASSRPKDLRRVVELERLALA